MPVAADPEEAQVEQADGTGGDPGPAQAASAETEGDPGAQLGQGPRHLPHMLVLGLFLPGAEPLVVEVLAAPGVVSVPTAWRWPPGQGQIQTSRARWAGSVRGLPSTSR